MSDPQIELQKHLCEQQAKYSMTNFALYPLYTYKENTRWFPFNNPKSDHGGALPEYYLGCSLTPQIVTDSIPQAHPIVSSIEVHPDAYYVNTVSLGSIELHGNESNQTVVDYLARLTPLSSFSLPKEWFSVYQLNTSQLDTFVALFEDTAWKGRRRWY